LIMTEARCSNYWQASSGEASVRALRPVSRLFAVFTFSP
jgi:hypothetical protein